MIWLAVLLLVIPPSLLFLWSLDEARTQLRINQTYVPANARIISSIATFYRYRNSRYFVPEINYEYDVNGTKYQSTNVTAIEARSSEDWVDSVVARYPQGLFCKAFYNPAKPDEAILLRVYSFTPYYNMLLMAACLTFGVFAATCARFSRPGNPVPAEQGWFELFPAFGSWQRLKSATICAVAYYSLVAFTGADFLHCVPPPYTSHSRNVLLGFTALGFVPLAFMARYFIITRSLDAPRLLLNRPSVALGQEFKFTISQRASRQVLLTSVRVRVRCTGTRAYGSGGSVKTVLHEEHPVTLKHHTVRAGETMELSGALAIPQDQLPTGRASHGNRWITWEVRLDCKKQGSPVYEAYFPLKVEPAADKGKAPPADLPAGAHVEKP